MKGEFKGHRPIWVNGKWQVTFRFVERVATARNRCIRVRCAARL
nr:type II toxin-antitoxin system RelE/ParE family toxin [Trinickia acidisoli]